MYNLSITLWLTLWITLLQTYVLFYQQFNHRYPKANTDIIKGLNRSYHLRRLLFFSKFQDLSTETGLSNNSNNNNLLYIYNIINNN